MFLGEVPRKKRRTSRDDSGSEGDYPGEDDDEESGKCSTREI